MPPLRHTNQPAPGPVLAPDPGCWIASRQHYHSRQVYSDHKLSNVHTHTSSSVTMNSAAHSTESTSVIGLSAPMAAGSRSSSGAFRDASALRSRPAGPGLESGPLTDPDWPAVWVRVRDDPPCGASLAACASPSASISASASLQRSPCLVTDNGRLDTKKDNALVCIAALRSPRGAPPSLVFARRRKHQRIERCEFITGSLVQASDRAARNTHSRPRQGSACCGGAPMP